MLQVVEQVEQGQLRRGGEFMSSLSGLGMRETTKALGEDKKDKAGNSQGQDGEVEGSIWKTNEWIEESVLFRIREREGVQVPVTAGLNNSNIIDSR